MRASPGNADPVRWTLEGFTVECPRAVLADIERDVLAGFHGLLEGGVEVGGVLFGLRTAGDVHVLAWRPVACEYASGPFYRLSEDDEAGLRRILESAGTDPELAGMAAVGWYRSHTRGGLAFLDEDLAVHRRHFPETGQVVLLLEPDRTGGMRTALFAGRGEGVVLCGGTAVRPPAAPAPARTHRWPWIAAAVILLLLFAVWWLRPTGSAIGLEVADHNGQLAIRWNRQARAVARATSGFVEIADGLHRVQIDLNPEQLRSGSVAYERTTPEATIRMVLHSPEAGAVHETVQFREPPARK